MREIFQYAAIGLGPAAVYALASAGVIAIYRGSGVVNFAQGGVALIAASVFVRTSLDLGWPIPVALVAAVLASTATSTVIGCVISGAMQRAAPVMKVIATLGVLSVLQELNFLALGGELRLVPHFLPSGSHEIAGVTIGNERIALLGIAVVVTVAMTLLYSRSSFGRLTSAAAEDRRATESLGHSAQRVAILNWALGGALAGVAGVLVLPVSGYSPGLLTLLILPAFATALLGRFTSLPVALLGAIILGVSQSTAVGFVEVIGVAEALPFVLIVLLLVVRSNSLPGRDELAQRLPRLASRAPSTATILGVAAVACTIVLIAGDARTAIILMIIASIAALSQVVLVGYGGQVSLGHASLAGVAALVSGRLNQAQDLPFPLAAVAGVVAAAVAGLIFGLPAIRARGVVLAIVTLGLGVSVSQVLFSNPDFTGGLQGTRTSPPSFAGIDLSSERSFGLFALVLATLIALLVRNLRKGRVGRRLLAIRSNERAATSIGIPVTGTKLYAFVVSASIVAVAGVLLAFRTRSVDYSNFDFRHNLLIVSAALIGGVGYLAGIGVAAFNTPGGLIEYWLRGVDNLDDWLLLVGGSLLVLTLVVHPDGVADAGERLASRMRRTRSRRAEPEPLVTAAAITEGAKRRDATCLKVEGLTVQFGAVKAVNEVSLVVRSGEILGVLGANGAGKTTLTDAVSGFVRANAGTIRLDGTDITRLKPYQRSLRGLGRSFQTVELFDGLTVRDNLLVACEETSRSMWLGDLLRPRRDGLSPYAQAVVGRLGLEPWIDRTPTELPQGPRALVGVARAIVTGCGILLLDEPAAGLDHQETKELGMVLRSICADLDIGILLIEHDVELVRSVSDRVAVLDFGALIFEGSCEDALSDARVKEAYLGVEVEPA
jgi:sulfate-transporting ATPase